MENVTNKTNRKKIIFVIIVGLIIASLAVTYAYLEKTLVGTKKQVITAGTLKLELYEDENNLTIGDAFPTADEVGIIQDAFTFRVVNEDTTAVNYNLKLVDITTVPDIEKMDENIIKYGLTKNGTNIIDHVRNLSDGIIDSGSIKSGATNNYELRLWIEEEAFDETYYANKTRSYRIDIEAHKKQGNNPDSAEEKLFATENLGENCKTYDDGIDTFLTGQCSQNYVWYSGKLWRVVLKNNETGAVKMITDNGITSISYNTSNNSSFENSYADQWLSQEFLPTLHDYEDYLVVDSVWDVTQNASSTPSRPAGTTVITRPVGLLNAYEYYTIYTNSDGLATSSTNYLHNKVNDTEGIYWLLMTPYSDSNINSIHYDGTIRNINSSGANPIRPTINLKSDIQIISGTGIQTDPYILEGDLQETENGATLLSTRYSGEYITFNSELYRIVDIENGLTKITAVNTPSALTNKQFHTDNTVISFASAQIKTVLSNYYQSLNTTSKNMIQTNMTWYLRTVSEGGSYKNGICGVVSTDISTRECERTVASTTANIGLSRIGEIFTSQITRKNKEIIMTLTPTSSSSIANVHLHSHVHFAAVSTDATDARPSMYLKSNVVIASTNTGNGTYEKPYSIELGS